MYQAKSEKLQSSMYSDRRAITVGYSYHGDLAISIHEDRDKNEFLFAHGSEVTIVASMIGYLARAGHSTTELIPKIMESGKEILKEYEEIERHRTPINRYDLRHVATGERYGRFNNLQMGWDALCVPIPKQPGIIEQVGGTGIYTREDVFGNKSLLLTDIPSRTALFFTNDDRKDCISELYESDIQPAIKLICEVAMGEYRTEVGWLLNDFVSQ